MDVSEEYLSHISVPLQQGGEIVRVREFQRVEDRVADVARRVVHEEAYIAAFGQTTVQPVQPCVAQETRVRSGFMCGQEYQAKTAELLRGLNEPAAGVAGMKDLVKGVPVVMVSKHRDRRKRQRVQFALEPAVGRDLSSIGQIAGQDAANRVWESLGRLIQVCADPGGMVRRVCRSFGVAQVQISD